MRVVPVSLDRPGLRPKGVREPAPAGNRGCRLTFRRRTGRVAVTLLLSVLPLPFACEVWLADASATVFHSREEALKLAFPDADRVEPRDYFLTAEQKSRIEARAKAPVDSDLITVYVGYRADKVLGHAIFETHVVRTLPETFLIVLSPDGKVAATHLLAFYEPLEYVPAERWLEQFHGKRIEDDLHVGRGIAAITGTTLTSRAVSASIRRALAIHSVLLGGS